MLEVRCGMEQRSARGAHNAKAGGSNPPPAIMSIVVESKKSGTKKWVKVTGSPTQLSLFARIFGLSIKPANGKNPPHIDIPNKHRL